MYIKGSISVGMYTMGSMGMHHEINGFGDVPLGISGCTSLDQQVLGCAHGISGCTSRDQWVLGCASWDKWVLKQARMHGQLTRDGEKGEGESVRKAREEGGGRGKLRLRKRRWGKRKIKTKKKVGEEEKTR